MKALEERDALAEKLAAAEQKVLYQKALLKLPDEQRWESLESTIKSHGERIVEAEYVTREAVRMLDLMDGYLRDIGSCQGCDWVKTDDNENLRGGLAATAAAATRSTTNEDAREVFCHPCRARRRASESQS